MLVFDARGTIGQGPGLHALIAGVGYYPYLRGGESPRSDLGLTQLTSATPTALAIYNWLVRERYQPQVPLATCRLLLSSSSEPKEHSIDLVDGASTATLSNFLLAAHELREDAATHPDSMVLVYLVGHGAQFGTEQIFFLRDFGGPIGSLLHNSIDMASLVDGLNADPARPVMAQTQLFFLDMSRRKLRELEPYLLSSRPTRVFDWPMARPEYRRSVTVFFAAQVEQHAYGIPDGLTLFGDALLSSLSGSAAEMLTTQGQQQWGVTSLSLFSGIQHEAQVAAERLNLPSPLKVEVSGTLTGRGAPFHCLKEPPHVRVSITVTPAEQNAELTIMNAQGQLVVTIEAAAHNTIELPAGIYLLSASIEGQEIRQIFDASPPNSEIVVNADVDPMVKY